MSNRVRTASLDKLIGILTAQLGGGLPADVARYELICAARKLSDTCLLTADFAIQTQKNCQTYYFDHRLPEHHNAIGIEAIKYCGECIRPIEKCDPCPRGYELVSPTAIDLHPCPTSDGQEIEMCVSLEPSQDACELPEVFLKKYDKELMTEAQAALMMYPNSEWTRPNIGQVYRREARANCINEAVRQSRGYDRNVQMNCGQSVV